MHSLKTDDSLRSLIKTFNEHSVPWVVKLIEGPTFLRQKNKTDNFTIGVVSIIQVMHVRNKNSNIQGSSPHVVSDFPALKGKNSFPLGANSLL